MTRAFAASFCYFGQIPKTMMIAAHPPHGLSIARQDAYALNTSEQSQAACASNATCIVISPRTIFEPHGHAKSFTNKDKSALKQAWVGTMRCVLGTVVAGALLLATPAEAGRGWYVGLEAGIGDPAADTAVGLTSFGVPGAPVGPPVPNFTSYSSDEGFVGLAVIGRHVSDNFRLELEASRRTAKFGPADIDQTALLLNGAFDIALIDDLSLSLGAGVGVDLISMDAGQSSDEEVVTALQLTAGLAYAIGDSTEVLLTLRHFGAPGSELGHTNPILLGDTLVQELSDTSVTVGLRFGL